jgi:hypothetical protein
VRTGRAVGLPHVLETTDLHSRDEYTYAGATSLVSFLLTRGDEETLLAFAEDGVGRGWTAALQSHYRISSLQQLQTQWQAWLANQF